MGFRANNVDVYDGRWEEYHIKAFLLAEKEILYWLRQGRRMGQHNVIRGVIAILGNVYKIIKQWLNFTKRGLVVRFANLICDRLPSFSSDSYAMSLLPRLPLPSLVTMFNLSRMYSPALMGGYFFGFSDVTQFGRV